MASHAKHNLHFFHSIWNVHASMNILDHTRLGHELFWRLLKTCSDETDVLHVKHINADGFAGVSAVRRVIRILETHGWVLVETHPDDARVRVVRVTPKFINHATNCFKEFDKVIEEYHVNLESAEISAQ